ncbi:MAG TPA: hypothetical protein VF608_03010 [Thermoanaerobaculia bacterium]
MNAQDEREVLLRSRFPRETEQVFGPPKFKSNSVILQIVFFVLTCLGIGAAYFFFDAIDTGAEGVITGVAAIGLAEYLILRRWFFTGVEAALWLGGLFAMITELPSTGAPEAMLVLGGAAAVAGLRVRNPLFGAVAAMFVAEYAERKADLGVIVALIIAVTAGLLLLCEWKRASTEWLWIALVVLLPIYGRVNADPAWRTTTILLYAAFAIAMLVLAFTRRHHAMLIAGIIGATIAAIEIGQRIATPLEVKLAFGGAFLLGGSLLVSRVLRDRTTGVVATLAQLTPIDDILQDVGTVAAAHAAGSPPPEAASGEARPSGDGGFGGAGASDSY